MANPKTATPRMAALVRNWIAGATLVLLLFGSTGAAYVGLNERITRSEAVVPEIRELLLRIESRLVKLEEKVEKRLGSLESKVGDLEVEVGKLKVQVGVLIQQNDGYEH